VDKSVVMVLARDIETAMKVLAEGLEQDDMVFTR
jgi:hypothetical protein